MADIDRIIEELLGSRRISEGAAFSSRTYADQPLIERGRDLKARIERREKERAARREQQAKARRAQASASRNAAKATDDTRHRAAPPRVDVQSSGMLFPIDFVMRRNAPTASSTSGSRQATRVDTSYAPTPVDIEPLPELIRQMRELESGLPKTLAYGSGVATTLFYLQAELMATYEDDYEYTGIYSQYYPTYATMNNRQARGYFTWRTRVRSGYVGPAPLSFAFVYVYELLCGIGTTPGEQGLHDLRSFGEAYRQRNEYDAGRLNTYLRRWIRDYAVYHNITSELAADTNQIGLANLTLLQAQLAKLKSMDRTPRVANHVVSSGPAPTPHETFQALGTAASYHICESRLAKDEPELLEAVTCDVFDALVEHCAKRRQTDFVEGLFGYAHSEPYTMFSAAIFYEEEPHADAVVEVSPIESFTCTNGRWRHDLACSAIERNKELGKLMHAVDYTLRKELSYPYPLKPRAVPKYVERIVQKAVAARLQERAEQERRRITIDRSKLGSIRAAAAITQEALLTDEDRDEMPAATWAPAAQEATWSQAQPHEEAPVPSAETDAPLASAPKETAPMVAEPVPVAPVTPSLVTPAPDDAPSDADGGSGLLNPLEARVMTGLMEGTPVAQLLGPTDPFPSVVVDAINEKLFDLVGDAVIEFDGDEPRIIEDYLEDVREVLAP